jgi:hypothetical protein
VTIRAQYIKFCFWSIVLLAITSCAVEMPEDVSMAYEELPEVIDFNIHIKPIISDRCYQCHGPDEQSRGANLRFDNEEGLFAKAESGKYAFIPGNVNQSESIKRILSDDPEYLMPSPKSNHILSADEKATIIKWVEQGAEWKEHWSFIPPEKTKVSDQSDGWKNQNEIDFFIQASLEKVGMTPSKEANKHQLLRRVTMELTGLPPTIKEIKDFINDDSSDAYEKVVDRLLGSDAYAERMTLEWLDVARYADSHGHHSDGIRNMWPWRDWVIRAFKNNMPYDEFATEQLAGDVIPDASKEQIIATAFNRNHPTNAESGIVDEEYRLEYVANRTNTLGTAFLGLTVECARCHDHKFDPISQKEYYQLSAFFNNVKELGMSGNDGDFGPMVSLSDQETDIEIKKLDKEIAEWESKYLVEKTELEAITDFISNVEFKNTKPVLHHSFETVTQKKTSQIVDDRKTTIQQNTDSIQGVSGFARYFNHQNDVIRINDIGQFESPNPFSVSAWVNLDDDTGKTKVIVGNAGNKNTNWRGWDFYLDSTNRVAVRLINCLPHNYIHVATKKSVQMNQWTHVLFTYDGSSSADGINIYVDGEESDVAVLYDELYKSILTIRRGFTRDSRGLVMGKSNRGGSGDNGIFKGSIDEFSIYDMEVFSSQVKSIYEQSKKGQVPMIYDASGVEYKSTFDQLSKLRMERLNIVDSIKELMVMREMPTPRPTFLLRRGAYDARDEQVYPGTPEKIMGMSDDLPQNRFGLSQWLFDPKNPLTARVAVNRYWQMIFGRGIVSTADDFGSQGALPTHPELLDWLAVEFMESGWDLKALLKRMVTSHTYRQSSEVSEKGLEQDAANKWLSRGPSYRWQAEFIRDNALASSGLLNKKLGGESVKPYQPDSLWIEKGNFSEALKYYVRNKDERQYRRSMYTFIRRTSPPPFMMLFDAPSREVCTITRERTNTPLQSLVLLNDPQFLEASRALAYKMKKGAGDSLSEKIETGFMLALSRPPSKGELDIFKTLYNEEIEEFKKAESEVSDYLAIGDFKSDDQYDPIEMAALTVLSNTLFNMDESFVKR